MENASYVTLSRQSGLLREMQSVANNIANASTTGYRKEGVIFAEFVRRIEGGDSLSMGALRARHVSDLQGALTRTGDPFDLAVEGPGYFLVETGEGERLTRAGSFTPGPDGELVTPDGHRLLDAGGAPVFAPPNAEIAIGTDGTLSADGRLVAQIGLYRPTDPLGLQREAGVLFRSEDGVEPEPGGRVLQGFLEKSNVDPVGQVARMIEVQRAYELGQSFLDAENERIRSAIRTFIE
ncbi:flagellar hook-basal body complex protein [Rhodosalinus sp. 5P4]|uniref:flagellar hook-basal body complex protein n=1 Tax=Rhodosalinus sp. 5P4 TaxID=3239196 RepID=UPI0035248831